MADIVSGLVFGWSLPFGTGVTGLWVIEWSTIQIFNPMSVGVFWVVAFVDVDGGIDISIGGNDSVSGVVAGLEVPEFW